MYRREALELVQRVKEGENLPFLVNHHGLRDRLMAKRLLENPEEAIKEPAIQNWLKEYAAFPEKLAYILIVVNAT